MPPNDLKRMPKIFIDANVWLGFWSINERRIPSELLPAVVKMRKYICFTEQLRDEIQRNKLSFFMESVKSSKCMIPSEFPMHLWNSEKVSSLNEAALQKLTIQAKAISAKWESVHAELANQIAMDADAVSVVLKPFVADAPTKAQLLAARDRRERGNPPGKRNDPLGDQISWQQFIEVLTDKDFVYLITKDRDFTQKVGDRQFLNPFLRNELSKIGVKDIYLYDNLAVAIKDLKKSGVSVAEDLSDDQLTDLGKIEQAHYVPIYPQTRFCVQCGTLNHDPILVAKPSQFGGWSYWMHCLKCGRLTDTGEPYDD